MYSFPTLQIRQISKQGGTDNEAYSPQTGAVPALLRYGVTGSLASIARRFQRGGYVNQDYH